jgi:ATP-dependent DNA helicase Rep
MPDPGLNAAQLEAVEHDLGPLLVLAGAGSGKTRVVTQRIARLLSRGVPARAILAMTFTNKAAREMRERVETLVGAKAAKELTVSTFHSFGLSVLQAETKALGFRGSKFVIFDQGDSSGVVREALRSIRTDNRSADRGFDIGAILARISALKNAGIDPDAFARGEVKADDPSEYDEITSLVYPRYAAMMRGFQAFDFDDLVCEVSRLWRRRDDVRQKYVKRFRYVIVDEYQDTNRAQLEVVRLLASDHKNVCVVGDDDQSIYAWRGADIRNILDFEEHFPGAKIVRLQENYRSTGEILKVASGVLEKSSARRHAKTIVATRGAGDRVREVVCADTEVEAAFVARTIEEFVRNGTRRKEIAVLYRSNIQSTEIEAALKERAIPMRMVGGTQFFERKEVKDLLAYLKVALTPFDEIALRRVINYPSRGIGDVALERLASHATANSTSLFTAVTRAHAVKDLAPTAIAGCNEFVKIIDEARDRLSRGELSAPVARAVAESARIKADIQAGSTSNAAATRRWGNVEGMLNVFARRDEKGRGERDQLEEFLRLLALRDDNEEAAQGDVVTLTTIHGAKGLEFDVVFLLGLEEGLMPHSRTQTERVTDVVLEGTSGVEEERRLFYVAVTRAKNRLFMSRCERRAFRGKVVARTPSRFLAEIPDELLDRSHEMTAAVPDLATMASGAAALLAMLDAKSSQPR